MKIIRPESNLDSFFSHVKASPCRALLLDYDGTLAPFHVERDQAFPYPSVRVMLNTILRAHHTHIVIISGRALRDLMPLLGLAEPVELWGSHGWEHWTPGGGYQIDRWSAQITRGLAEARTWIEHQDLEKQCERKPAGLALHWRGLTPAAASALHERVSERWAQISHQYGLALHHFDGGIELRIPGRDKGTVVQTILDQHMSAGAIAYAGDDLTDEDAFKALSGHGFNILVRRELRPTAADLWLRPPDELIGFLERWHQSCAHD